MFPLRIIFSVAAAILFAVSAATAAPPRQKPAIAEFDVGADGDFIVLALTIDQHEYPFLMNTGLPTTVVDETLRKKFDLRKLEPGPGALRSGTRHERYGGLRAALGNLRLEFPEGVDSADYKGMREGLDIEVFGEIGMDFLAPFIVQIDFDQGKLRFLSSLPPAPGEAIRIKQPGDESRIPRALVALAGQPAQKFLISTARGGNSLDVTPDLLAKLEDSDKVRNLANERGVQRSGTRRFDAFRVDWAQVGSIRTEGLICNSSELNGLGLSYLARFLVTFDFPRGKMFLKRAAHFSEPDSQLDLEEVAVERAGEKVTLRDVNRYGPAGRLGLRRGDVLESINGHPTRSLTNWQVRRLLGQRERAITVIVRRGDEQLALRRNAIADAPPTALGEDSSDRPDANE